MGKLEYLGNIVGNKICIITVNYSEKNPRKKRSKPQKIFLAEKFAEIVRNYGRPTSDNIK